MRITISGLSGCGNTTATRNVAKALGLKVINYTFRDLAKDLGLPFETLQKMSKKDPVYDYILEYRQISFAEQEPGCVIGTRLAGWVIDNADLRVWLHAAPEARARRIALREDKPFREVLGYTTRRDHENAVRYKKHYGIDLNDRDGFDLIVNTEYLTAAQVSALIVAAAKLAKENNLLKPSRIAKHVKALITKKLKNNKLWRELHGSNPSWSQVR